MKKKNTLCIYIYAYKKDELTKRDACGQDGDEDEIFKLFVLRQGYARFPGITVKCQWNGKERNGR